MVLFRLYRTLKYWKYEIFTYETFREYMFFVGVFYAIRPLLKFFNYNYSDVCYLIIALSICVVIILLRKRPKGIFSYRIYGTDASIEIVSGDIFKQKGAIVIPCNTSFDTKVNEQIISRKSVQGIFTSEVLNGDVAYLDEKINYQLRDIQYCKERTSMVGGNSKIYKMGTTIEIDWKDEKNKYYLLSMAELNEFGIASTDREKLVSAMEGLWDFIATKSSLPDVINIPLLGTNFGRSNLNAYSTVLLIAMSYIKNRHERALANKLRIIILDDVFLKHYEEIRRIQPIIKEFCNAPRLLNILNLEAV